MSSVYSALFVIILLVSSSHGVTYRVSKTGGGQFSSVQAAINQARPGDLIEIIDLSTYEEQVTIDSTKNGLTLKAKNPSSKNKPVIRFLDSMNVHPKTAAEALDKTKWNYDRNGALRIIGASQITIDGIVVDGGGHYTYCWEGIWDGKYPLFSGNAAISLYQAGYAVIRNCDIRNSHFGISFKNLNEGGIYANANPADIKPWLVVPLSRYGKMGGHLVEQNRIHHNVFGIFTESDWDMGSTIRYNLLYENHYTDEEAKSASKMDGASHPGGAFEFKDIPLTLWAIYNNTFWHNFCHFSGHWQAGPQHLIFNNVYGIVNKLWSEDSIQWPITTQSMDKAFPNRMKHCVYDLMMGKPKYGIEVVRWVFYDSITMLTFEYHDSIHYVEYLKIQEHMEVEKTDTVIKYVLINPFTHDTVIDYKTIQNGCVKPGAAIKPFAADARIGYYPVKFKSTDTASSDFLVPDWDDTVVQRLILDNGYPDAGILDADGTPADLGAISKGGIPTDNVTIRSISPVIINGNEAAISFSLQASGTFLNPSIKYFRSINPLKNNFNSWGNAVQPIPAANIQNVAVNSGTPLTLGQNLLKVTPIPTPTSADPYALYEMFIEGTNSQGKKVVSSAGFHPFRNMNYYFKIWAMNLVKSDTLDTIAAGETVLLCIEAYKKDGSNFANNIDSVVVSLVSGFTLYSKDMQVLSGKLLPGGMPKGYKEVEVIFTKAPKPDGFEYVQSCGLWSNQQVAFHGVSDKITILGKRAAKVVLQDPVSKAISPIPTTISPGIDFQGYLQLFDVYDNPATTYDSVKLSVLNNNTNGLIKSPALFTTNSQGRGDFVISVNGNVGDTVSFVAMINGEKSPVYDTAVVIVGDKVGIIGSQQPGFNNLKCNIVTQNSRLVYSIPSTGNVRIDIIDLKGRLVATLVNAVERAGAHSIHWEGRSVGSSVYFIRFSYGKTSMVKKVAFIK